MQRMPTLQVFWSLVLVVVISLSPSVPPIHAAPQDTGPGAIHRSDACSHLPNPPGNAFGIEKHCPHQGSSSGVVKGDFNGDGYADLVIGEPDAAVGGQAGAGDLIVLYGSPDGLTKNGPQEWDDAKLGLTPGAGDGFGTALASGDFNGDGFSDLAIGIPGRSISTPSLFGATVHPQAGVVFVIYGSPNGLTITDQSVPAPRRFDLTMTTLPALPFGCGWNLDGARLGSALAWGDFNNDGIGDLAAGAHLLANLLPLSPCSEVLEGGVWELLGSTSGLRLTGNQIWTQANLPGLSTNAGLELGFSLAGGDFNSDGYADLAIGAPGMQTASGAFGGGVVIVFGGTLGVNPGAGIRSFTLDSISGAGSARDDDFFGVALAAGDFNGDTNVDLAIGIPARAALQHTIPGAGAVAVLYGTHTTGLTTANAQLWDENAVFTGIGVQTSANDGFGSALAAGDFNGDGRADLAIGVPFKEVAEGGTFLLDAGQVDVIYGSSSGLATTHPPQRWTEDTVIKLGAAAAGNHFGASLSAWNFGRDETTNFLGHPGALVRTADLAIGIPNQNVVGLPEAGAVNVLYGSFFSGGLVSRNSKGEITAQEFTAQTILFGGIPQGAQARAHFGMALY